MHLQGVQRLLRLVNGVHHKFIYLPVDEDVGSSGVVRVLELTVLGRIVVLLVLLADVIWTFTVI